MTGNPLGQTSPQGAAAAAHTSRTKKPAANRKKQRLEVWLTPEVRKRIDKEAQSKAVTLSELITSKFTQANASLVTEARAMIFAVEFSHLLTKTVDDLNRSTSTAAKDAASLLAAIRRKAVEILMAARVSIEDELTAAGVADPNTYGSVSFLAELADD